MASNIATSKASSQASSKASNKASYSIWLKWNAPDDDRHEERRHI